MNIPVLSKNAEGLEGLANEEAAPKKNPVDQSLAGDHSNIIG